jgi:mRNA-degrading endonuclease RelE of RelBE toxin-antitoxin system
MYAIRFSAGVKRDLGRIRAFDRKLVLDAIEKQLAHEPDTETRNRKMLTCLVPTFKAVPPIWQLRVGNYRVFYDVDEKEKIVWVRAVRKKPAHRTTEEIL